jgi:hypothetical protein
MQTPFELAQRIFQNASNFSIQCYTISDYPPVEELIKETRKWFSELENEDDDSFKSIRIKIWRLRASVVYSLLPFDSKELGIAEQLQSLQREAAYVPFLQERVDRLTKILQFLLVTSGNPKREKVFELLRACPEKGRGTGIVVSLVRGATPGWSKTVADEILNLARECEFIQGSKGLKRRTYQQLILPGSGRLSPVVADLYHGCRTERLDIVVYKMEGVYTPRKRSLPKGTYVKRKPLKLLPAAEYQEQPSSETQMDEWVQRRFWESLREHLPGGMSSVDQDREFFVKARIVILTDNRKVCLREDMHIIEISELVDGQTDFETSGRRYPRRRVDQLKEGDLIVLRTSGSGEYLVDFANALMEADGRGNLRATALDWKPLLREALLVHGSEKISGLLTSKGHNVGNHRYIWMWTTDLVIRPKSQSLFLDLMNILDSLGFGLKEGDPFAAAAQRWKKMKEIIRYHVTAGQRIRLSLLDRLRNMIKDRLVITDSYHLSLPGLSAGEISVVRVAAVDSVSIDIPYHQAGVITPLER